MISIYSRIANHLGVEVSEIIEVKNWAQCLWVRVARFGSRFVSKKVLLGLRIQRTKTLVNKTRMALLEAMTQSLIRVMKDTIRIGNGVIIVEPRGKGKDKQRLCQKLARHLSDGGFMAHAVSGVVAVPVSAMV